MKALLAAMRADPDNREKRAVYLDHLEESGQPEYADCLRLEQRFHDAIGLYDRRDAWIELVKCCRPLQPDWKRQALRTYDVVMALPGRTLFAMKELRFLLGIDMRTAHRMVNELPLTVASGLTGVYAFAVYQRLQRAEADVDLHPAPAREFPDVSQRFPMTLAVDDMTRATAFGPWPAEPVDGATTTYNFTGAHHFEQIVVAEMVRALGQEVPAPW